MALLRDVCGGNVEVNGAAVLSDLSLSFRSLVIPDNGPTHFDLGGVGGGLLGVGSCVQRGKDVAVRRGFVGGASGPQHRVWDGAGHEHYLVGWLATSLPPANRR
eukprot:TRINITY_DN927_c0_g1_i1.p5 TRINITY_DN927_c0_g1~~TRINITY_DN927_c0_g1_i1.p5  ORF type:complete len:104 (-),score=14.10 TRINITY_DN927_c0_g1_i1:633-944(-)